MISSHSLCFSKSNVVLPEPDVSAEESSAEEQDDLALDSNSDGEIEKSKGGGDKELLIIEEDDESKGENDEVPPKTPVLKHFTNLIKSFFSNGKETATDKESEDRKPDDHKSKAKNALSILRAQVEKEVQAEVCKQSYKELRSKCSQLKLGGNGSAAVLKKRLKKFLIEERFQLQLMEFEKQIKTHKPDAYPEDFFDLEETIKDFNSNYVDI